MQSGIIGFMSGMSGAIAAMYEVLRNVESFRQGGPCDFLSGVAAMNCQKRRSPYFKDPRRAGTCKDSEGVQASGIVVKMPQTFHGKKL